MALDPNFTPRRIVGGGAYSAGHLIPGPCSHHTPPGRQKRDHYPLPSNHNSRHRLHEAISSRRGNTYSQPLHDTKQRHHHPPPRSHPFRASTPPTLRNEPSRNPPCLEPSSCGPGPPSQPHPPRPLLTAWDTGERRTPSLVRERLRHWRPDPAWRDRGRGGWSRGRGVTSSSAY